MKLNRSKENKWIFQKNVSSTKLIFSFLEALKKQDNKIDYKKSLESLRNEKSYKGRSKEGTTNTLGVRMSQLCFYMFGYRSKMKKFVPSISTQLYKKSIDNEDKNKALLINLFSLQYPNPYSKTPNNFRIYTGRFIIKLLLEERLNKRLYIDEFIWFLPFIEKINKKIYDELICEILEYRKKSYEEKLKLFKNIKNYDSLFANVLHEVLYYFINIFESLEVIKKIEDPNHNSGKLFKFKHNKDTFRNDAIKSRGKYSGYIELNEELIDYSKVLLEKHSCFEEPLTEDKSSNREDWIRELYEFNMLEYYYDIDSCSENIENLNKIIKEMIYNSKYGTNDGKSFEKTLKPCFELFREIVNVEIISGSGDTDLLCNVIKNNNKFKINVDAKKTQNRLNSINPMRIKKHQIKNGSNYSVIISPKFAKGAIGDISEFKIVTIEAEVLANYCLKECLSSDDGLADFSVLDDIINENYGKNISEDISNLIIQKYKMD